MLNIFSMLAAFVAGLLKTAFGIGAGVFLTPLLSLTMDPKTAVALMAPMMLITDISTLGTHWKRWDKKQLLIILPGALLGTILGSYYLVGASPEKTKITIGTIAILFSTLQILRIKKEKLFTNIKFSPWQGSIISIAAGTASAIAHSGGIVLTIYLITQNLKKETFVATLVGFLLFADCLKIVMFSRLGILTLPLVKISLFLVPVLFLGSWAGSKLIKKISDKQFVIYINILIFISGLILLIKH